MNIAIFASGTGSNAQHIINEFKGNTKHRVALIVSNKEDAGVLDIAEQEGIEYAIAGKEELADEETMLALLDFHKIDFIVLAGFLLLDPIFPRSVRYCLERINETLRIIRGGLRKRSHGHHGQDRGNPRLPGP